MAMVQKVKLYGMERLEIPDMNNFQDFVEEDFQLYNTKLFSATTQIVSGFETSDAGGLTIEVTIPGSCLIHSSGTYKIFFVADLEEDDLSETMTPGVNNYVHLQLTKTSGSSTQKAFWDKTANNNAGAEFVQDVNTAEYLEASLYVLTTGWSSDPDKIPIALVDAGAVAINAIHDRRNLLFCLRTGTPYNAGNEFTLLTTAETDTDFSGGDRYIKTFKDWMNYVMTKFKKIQGTAYWFEDPPSSLATIQYKMTDGGIWSWVITPTPDISAYTVGQNARIENPNTGVLITPFTGDGTLVGTFNIGVDPITIDLAIEDVISLRDNNTASARYVVRNTAAAGPGVWTITVEQANLSFTANAYFVILGTPFTNTIQFATQSPITLGAGWVAYVDIDVTASVNLTVNVVRDHEYVNDEDRSIIARRYANTVYVG